MLQIVNSLDRLESYDTDVLSIFDLHLLPRLDKWLLENPKRFLICIEKNLQAFLQAKAQLQDPRIRLYYWDSNASLCSRIIWEFCLLRLTQVAIDEEERTFSQMLKEMHVQVHLLISDFRDLGEVVIANLLQNIDQIPVSLLGESLENCCQNIPAIICGAGPSLDRQIPMLAQTQERALLFGAGSAMCALETQGIYPHFGVAFDPDPPPSRYLAQTGYETPYFYQSRISSRQLASLHGQKLWISDSDNYPLEKWIYQELGLGYPLMDSGFTSANFCALIAAHLGCNPIICVGMDFCSPKHQVYAASMQADQGNWVECINAKKEKRISKPDWLASASWLDQFAEKNKVIEWIYTDQEAMSLAHVKYLPLEQISLPSAFDTASFSYALTDRAARSEITQESVRAVLHKLSNSFTEALNLCNQLLKLWEKHYPHSILETGELALLESDLAQNICVQKLLLPLWEIWKWPILRQEEHIPTRVLHQHLFFKKAVEIHLSTFKSVKI
ncbi:motility associated factor glycosyltransferase family protein [Candidatus Rhabdochlamydia porcellionis]|jgi:uncharacterized Rossmann fold enzyme|uniref:6-hydroxymethylpterin diphosphokinase MptE-like domain-containing protein n=1 Tax=Candidatus Rhabdochlamydia porcellionis TaxID=225148 RepID=A0ABX8Z4B2_9BACT|nr:6-hydroxymethylpterin diphosphokinase MptE-like protein [Candidatus Rhabdochlamydia porcellionis]QZA59148.1 Protein of unknown function DUF115 [Candidatus Rhabdochlamydia porcellionis]